MKYLRGQIQIVSSALAIACFGAMSFGQHSITRPASSCFSNAAALIQAGHVAEGCQEAQCLLHKAAPDAMSWNLLGICAVQGHNFNLAEQYFQKSIALDPNLIASRIDLGLSLLQQGKNGAARSELIQALRVSPNNPLLLYRLGQAEISLDMRTQAIEHLKHAVRLNPEDARIALSYAAALVRGGELSKAQAVLRSYVDREEDGHMLLSLAVIAGKAGNAALAREAVEKAIRIDEKLQDQVLAMARQANAQDEYGTTRTLLSATRKYQHNLPEWNALLGYADYKLGDPGDALEHLRRAVATDPKNEDYYLRLGELLLYYNSVDVAIDVFQTGLSYLPNSALLHYGLGVSYWFHERDVRRAADNLEKAIRIEPDFVPAISLLCEVLYRQQRFGDLEQWGKRLSLQHDGRAMGEYYQALALAKGAGSSDLKGNLLMAQQLLRDAILQQPHLAVAHRALGEILFDEKRIPESIKQFKQAIAIKPDTETYYHLAMAYRRVGRVEESRTMLNKLAALRRQDKDKYLVLFSVSR